MSLAYPHARVADRANLSECGFSALSPAPR